MMNPNRKICKLYEVLFLLELRREGRRLPRIVDPSNQPWCVH